MSKFKLILCLVKRKWPTILLHIWTSIIMCIFCAFITYYLSICCLFFSDSEFMKVLKKILLLKSVWNCFLALVVSSICFCLTVYLFIYIHIDTSMRMLLPNKYRNQIMLQEYLIKSKQNGEKCTENLIKLLCILKSRQHWTAKT